MKKHYSLFYKGFIRTTVVASLAILVIIGSQLSCKRFVDIPLPQDRVSADQVFTTDEKANAAVAGIYGSMINSGASFSSSMVTILEGMASDELLRMDGMPEDQEFMENQINPSNGYTSSLWNSIYKHIYYANAAIEGLTASTGVSKAVKEKLIGEAKFLRAFCNFYLVQLYGKAPLITSTDYRVNATLTNASEDEIYQQILTDLQDAVMGLPETTEGAERTRADKWAAMALLARVHFFLADWKSADDESTEVINSGLFTPLVTPNEVFGKNSREAIWQLLPNENNSVLPELIELFPYGTVPNTYLRKELLNSFEAGDNRRAVWLDSLVYEGDVYYYPIKYKNVSASIEEYYTMLRIAEQYLIRAEARLNQQNTTGALEDLNVIRERAGLIPIEEMTQDQIKTAILQERRIEFFSEWGLRWIDLKRTGLASKVLAPIKTSWQDSDTLFPIPANELLSNPNLKQNPGY